MAVRPGYKQTAVGVIPEAWEVGTLSNFWTVTDCKHITAKFVGDGFPIASIKEVQSRFVDLTNAKQTTPQFYNLLIEGGRKPVAGDLILSRNATVGEIAQVAEWHPPFAMGQDVCLLRKKLPFFSTEYLQEVFRSSIIQNQLADLMVGSTFKRANVQQIKGFIIPMPPPAEQQAIAEALSDVDGLISSLDALIAKKRAIKQGAMQELLTGQRRLPGLTGEWEVKILGELAIKIGSGITPTGGERVYKTEGRPFIRSQNVGWGMLLMDDIAFIDDETHASFNATEIRMHDVLLNITGASIGRSAVADQKVESGNVNQHVCIIRPVESELDPYFLNAFLLSRQGQKQIDSFQSGGNRQGLNFGQIRTFVVNLPPLPEQTAIAQILTDMDAELAALVEKRDKTVALKQGMMQELLTGKTRLV